MAERLPFRSGIGYDSHRFAPGGPLVLGGVEIDADVHLRGHSDGDAIAHAVTDAVLGAAGLGDIGVLFPDTDPANAGRDSIEMLILRLRRARLLALIVVVLGDQGKQNAVLHVRCLAVRLGVERARVSGRVTLA